MSQATRNKWFSAASTGDLNRINEILQNADESFDINSKEWNLGRTALLIAIHESHTDLVNRLIEAGAEIGSKEVKSARILRRTAIVDILLHEIWRRKGMIEVWPVAAAYGNERIMHELIEAGLSAEQEIYDNETAILIAAEHGNLDAVKVLIHYGADGKEKALIRAVEHGHEDVTELLLVNNANIEHVVEHNNTALMLAAKYGHEKIIPLLRRFGANIEHIDRNGHTALTLAVHNWVNQINHTVTIEKLLVEGANIDHIVDREHSALTLAVLAGNLFLVRLLLQFGANVEHKCRNGLTPLMLAVTLRQIGIINSLLASGADIENTTHENKTALTFAAELGYERILELLIQKGANIEHISHGNNTPLTMAITSYHFRAVKVLLAHEANTEHTVNDNHTALTLAAKLGQSDSLQVLLENGARIDHAAQDGYTALILATKAGHANIVEKLVSNGANTEHLIENGNTALTLAVKTGQSRIIEILLQNGANMEPVVEAGHTPLTLAIKGGYADIVKKLISGGADIEHTTEEGHTALTLAAQYGYAHIVQTLILNGANVEHETRCENTALSLAYLHDNLGVFEILLKNFANLEHVIRENHTVLTLAASKGDAYIVERLLDCGANVEHASSGEHTALTLASEKGEATIVKSLLSENANIEHITSEKQNALTLAVLSAPYNRSAETIIKRLLDSGVDIDYKNGDSDTAIILASRLNGDRVEIVEYLLGKGADILHRNSNGRRALDCAKESENHRVVELLKHKTYLADLRTSLETEQLFSTSSLRNGNGFGKFNIETLHRPPSIIVLPVNIVCQKRKSLAGTLSLVLSEVIEPLHYSASNRKVVPFDVLSVVINHFFYTNSKSTVKSIAVQYGGRKHVLRKEDAKIKEYFSTEHSFRAYLFAGDLIPEEVIKKRLQLFANETETLDYIDSKLCQQDQLTFQRLRRDLKPSRRNGQGKHFGFNCGLQGNHFDAKHCSVYHWRNLHGNQSVRIINGGFSSGAFSRIKGILRNMTGHIELGFGPIKIAILKNLATNDLGKVNHILPFLNSSVPIEAIRIAWIGLMKTKKSGTQPSSCYTKHTTREGTFLHLAALPSKVIDGIKGWMSKDEEYIYFYVDTFLFRMDRNPCENGTLHLIQVPEKSVVLDHMIWGRIESRGFWIASGRTMCQSHDFYDVPNS